MNKVPDEIPGLGSTSARWRQNPQFDATGFPFDQDSYFIWSRFDGHSTVREIVLMVGLPIERSIEVLHALRDACALLRPGESPSSVASIVEAARRERSRMREQATAQRTDGPAASSSQAGAPSFAAPIDESEMDEPESPSSIERKRDVQATIEKVRLERAKTEEPTPRMVADVGVATTMMSSGWASEPSEPSELSKPAGAGEPVLAAATPSASVSATETDAAVAAPADANADVAAELGDLSPEEAMAMAVPTDLSMSNKIKIIKTRRRVREVDFFELFGVEREVDKKQLKRTYFKLSKAFHPDRFYGKDTGSFGPWISELFELVSQGFQTLKDKRTRRKYIAALDGQTEVAAGSQTREEYARDLFDQACTAETQGDMAQALKLFSAVTRLDPKARYLSRAARCATAANTLDVAEHYALQARTLEPANPSVARILSDVYRQAGKLDKAEETLLHALDIKSENDQLVGELQRDLQAVRAALAEN